jgi:hypothetical protein
MFIPAIRSGRRLVRCREEGMKGRDAVVAKVGRVTTV